MQARMQHRLVAMHRLSIRPSPPPPSLTLLSSCHARSISSFAARAAARPRRHASTLNGRGPLEAAPTVRLAAWLLSREQTDEHVSARFAFRISPWVGSENAPKQFTDEDSKGSDWPEARETETGSTPPPQIHDIIPMTRQRTQWVLPFADPRLNQIAATSSERVHRKPPPEAKCQSACCS
jgi:hypothetical protein